MRRCPDCGFRVKENLRDCPLCGVRMHIVPDGQTNNYATHVHSKNDHCMLPNKTCEAAKRWYSEKKEPQEKKSVLQKQTVEKQRKQEKQPAAKADAKKSADMAKFWIGLIVMLFFWFLESCTF